MSDSSRFTGAELEQARSTDLPNLLQSLGYHVTRKGHYHSTAEMDSLRIKNRRTWFRYSEQVGGDAIAFLQHFQNMDFVAAVKYLLSFNGHSRDAPELPEAAAKCPWCAPDLNARPTPPVLPAETGAAEFSLPPPAADHRHVYAYLRKRGIAAQVTDGFLAAGLLYEDSPYHNCVFVGKNSSGKAVFANKRGTYDQGENAFKGDVPGSDKSIAFRLPADPSVSTVHVFESLIDCMSYMTLHRELRSNAVALCCLHDGALNTYLSEHPHIKTIVLCLDNDQWGRKAASRLVEKYRSIGYTVHDLLPPLGKDWNEYLQYTKQKSKLKEK